MKRPIWMGGALLGMAHAMADATSGFLLFAQSGLPESAWYFLGYNLLAFAFQPMVGIWVDKSKHPQGYTANSLMAMGGLAICAPLLPLDLKGLLICTIALASACFHVSAGSLCLQSKSPLSQTTLFAAPGVLGLSLGSYAGLKGQSLSLVLGFALLLSGWAISRTRFELKQKPESFLSPNSQVKQEWWLMALICLIALRSLCWNQFQIQSPVEWLFWLGFSACLGKLAGGWLTQTWSAEALLWPSLGLAWLGFILGPQSLFLTCLGIAALQSTAPLTFTALGQTLPQRPALASGLALGFALALGGLPHFLKWPPF